MAKPKHKIAKKSRPIKRIFQVILALFTIGILGGVSLFAFYAATSPNISKTALSSDNSTKFYDSKGKLISRLGAQNRDYVSNKDIPQSLKSAIVSIEDRRFYKHHGVDPVRILGAAFANVKNSSGMQGGSTLTQQLVKLSVFSTDAKDRTLKRKAQEAWLSVQVDKKYSKDQILEFYINKVYMGNGIYGMQTAAEYYYNKPLSELNLSQTALLAGMPQSPTSYDPYTYPQYATNRRNEVLNAMVDNKVITSEQANEAKKVNVTTDLATKHSSTQTSQATDKYVDAYLKESISELNKRGYKTNSGLKVYTNLDLSAQKKLYNVANNDPSILYPSNEFQLGATLVDVNTGKVVAMQGNRLNKVSFGLNRAVQTDRSSGSSIKPLMDYAPAIEYLKYPTYQAMQDTPFTYPGSDKQLMDFDNQYEGTITMRKALVESRNIPAIRTLQNVGMDRATSFLKKLGMSFDKPLELQNGIGAYISTEQEAAAYAAFANGGTYYKPYLINKIESTDGQTKEFSSKGHKVMSSATAFMITNMLKGVITDSNGSGTAAKITGLYQAGKTGSTQYPSDYLDKVPSEAAMDSWFTGYTQNYSLSVWTGYDQQYKTGHYITQEQTKIAQEIYKSVMTDVSTNVPNTDWSQPNDVVATRVNGKTEYYVSGYPGSGGDVTNNQTSNQVTNNQATTNNTNQANNSVTNEAKKEEDNQTQTTTSDSNKSSEGGTSSNTEQTPDDNTTSNGDNTSEDNTNNDSKNNDTNTNNSDNTEDTNSSNENSNTTNSNSSNSNSSNSSSNKSSTNTTNNSNKSNNNSTNKTTE